MKLAIMQPYFFPYIGYFQLIQAVDTFVIYDDVNYIKKGWVNRNFILAQGNKQLATLPLKSASQNKLINQIEICTGKEKLLRSIYHSYCKAPYFANVFPLIEDILLQKEENLAAFLDYQLQKLCLYLELNPVWLISSKLKKNNELRGQDKIINICKELKATQYINLPSGVNLYNDDSFISQNIILSFIHQKTFSYKQFSNEFSPNLSIIDVLMFNNKKQCLSLLTKYQII